MKVNSLLDQYIFSRKMLSVSMPIAAVSFVISAIVVMIITPKFWWFGLIFLGIAALVIIEFFFIRRYIDKKIRELSEEEKSKIKGIND